MDIPVAGAPLRLVPDAELCLNLLTRLPRPGHPYLQKPRHCVARPSIYQNLNGVENAKMHDKKRLDTRSDSTGALQFVGNALHSGQQIAVIVGEARARSWGNAALLAVNEYSTGPGGGLDAGVRRPSGYRERQIIPVTDLERRGPLDMERCSRGIVTLTPGSQLRAAVSGGDAKSVDPYIADVPEGINAGAVGSTGLNPDNLRISPPSWPSPGTAGSF